MSDHDPLCRWPDRWAPRSQNCDCDLIAKARADERYKRINPYDDYTIHQISDAARAQVLADFRAQVEALRAPVIDDYSGGWDAACIDVLALFGGSDA